MYAHSSKYHAKTREEWLHNRYLEQQKLEENYELSFKSKKKIDRTKESAYNHARALLDSSLISESKEKIYTIKVREVGDYYQVYYYSNKKKIKDKTLEKDLEELWTPTEYHHKNTNDLKKIETRNIRRSKYSLQNLIKANEKEFKTFITLTFEDNIIDISVAHKKFHIWRRNIKRSKSDFMYVCVPEFQKRGAVHYHLLTNIDYTDYKLISKEFKTIWNRDHKRWENFRTVNSWCYGHSRVDDMKDINVVGYLSKYMTKDIDNRLWGKRRYYYSQNLRHPTEIYLNLDDLNDYKYFVNCFNGEERYTSTYKDYYGDDVVVKEYKKGE